MLLQIEIERRMSPEHKPYTLTLKYETENKSETVAAMLQSINSNSRRQDAEGKSFEPVRWECSCLQKKCGACAMVINGRPMLACDAKLLEAAKRGRIAIGPLKKFPPVADLIVDRGPMLAALSEAKLWLTEQGLVKAENTDLAFEASRCLQCGCCLEVCPNFYAGGSFMGMAAAMPGSRLLLAAGETDKAALAAEYKKHVYGGCGKSLACRSICPAGIDIEALLVNSNAAAVWKRPWRKK